ncbi:hypothetical protein J2128_002004 [Methanomicrobium sp. W14]|uniref:hypothetical protein n=1 Tax=Methanomicrobium sp. W14 TaxID=2817839 RepID=UPI001AE6FCDD|nr:hypothetical protein [Methanomicrobium sp. W14]MBP2134038.1 hypothetical protein [Methanomicrobium sp. W14]
MCSGCTQGYFESTDTVLMKLDANADHLDAPGNAEKSINILQELQTKEEKIPREMYLGSASESPDGNITAVLTEGSYNTMQQPVIIAELPQKWNLLMEEVNNHPDISGTDKILYTDDIGFLLGKYRSLPDGGQKIVTEKTDAANNIVWDTTIASSDNTVYKYGDIIGISENSVEGYDIIYHDHENA